MPLMSYTTERKERSPGLRKLLARVPRRVRPVLARVGDGSPGGIDAGRLRDEQLSALSAHYYSRQVWFALKGRVKTSDHMIVAAEMIRQCRRMKRSVEDATLMALHVMAQVKERPRGESGTDPGP